jgi:hypothetical protein
MPRLALTTVLFLVASALFAQTPQGKFSWQDRSGTTGHTVTVDGKSYGPYKDVKSVTHSTSGTAGLFLVTKRDKTYILAQGKELGPLPTGYEVDQSYISDDGKIWAVTATLSSDSEDGKNQTQLWVNGKVYGPYDAVNTFEYAETGGGWVASVQTAEDETTVLVNGTSAGPFASVDHTWMSLDGKIWGYAATDSDKTTVVTQDNTYNDVQSYNADMMYPREPHWALAIQTGDQEELVVVDGKSYSGYLNFSGLSTTYTNRHWGFQADKMGDSGDYPVIVIDGKEFVGEELSASYADDQELFTWTVRDGDKTTVQVLSLP